MRDKRRVVLVVEDEPDLANLVMLLLSSEGYRPVLARNGCDALRMAARDRPAAILLDLALPDLDGQAVLRALKAQPATSGIPVIVLSAYLGRLTTGDQQLLYHALQKPFDLDDLVGILGNAITTVSSALLPPVSGHRRRRTGAMG